MAINQDSTEATKCLCPFEDRDVWSPTWKRPGVFALKLLSPAQKNQIFSYFAEGARAIEEERQQGRRIAPHNIYRVSIKSVAAYFNVKPNTLSTHVLRSTQFKQFLQVSTQDASLSDATASVMESIPAIQGAEVAQIQFAQVAAGDRAIGDGEAGDDQPISALGKRPAPQWHNYFWGPATDLLNARRDGEYPACSKYRESQLRDRPGSFLKKGAEGCLLHPIASADYANAPNKRPPVHPTAPEQAFAKTQDAIGYTLVRLVEGSDEVLKSGSEAERGFKEFVREAYESDSRDGQPIIGQPLFLDHLDPVQETQIDMGWELRHIPACLRLLPPFINLSSIRCRLNFGAKTTNRPEHTKRIMRLRSQLCRRPSDKIFTWTPTRRVSVYWLQSNPIFDWWCLKIASNS